MTKAQRTRALVLENTHLPEAEIAQIAGISEDDVWRILDAVEAPPRREVVAQQEKRTALPRSSLRTGVKYTVQKPPPPAPTPKLTGTALRQQTNHNGLPPAEHGTEGGYSRHQRHKEDACDPCKEAMRLRAARRRQKLTESQVTA